MELPKALSRKYYKKDINLALFIMFLTFFLEFKKKPLEYGYLVHESDICIIELNLKETDPQILKSLINKK